MVLDRTQPDGFAHMVEAVATPRNRCVLVKLGRELNPVCSYLSAAEARLMALALNQEASLAETTDWENNNGEEP